MSVSPGSSSSSSSSRAKPADPQRRPDRPVRAPRRRRRQLPVTSILSRSKLVALAVAAAEEAAAARPAPRGGASGDTDSAAAAAAAAVAQAKRVRSLEKHVDALQHQFVDFERKHFWDRGHLTLVATRGSPGGPGGGSGPGSGMAAAGDCPAAAAGAEGLGGAAAAGRVLPQFNVHNEAGIRADVPRVLKTTVAAHCGPLCVTSKVVRTDVSGDGDTVKLLVELQDGFQVESVIMRHRDERTGKRTRATLCVSSQVGCKMGCKFCATGTLGELGNLSAGEILEQLVFANRINDTPMRNVVFMGMGEPLNNYANVVEAVRAMISPRGFGLAATRVTVSTVGIVPRMEQLVQELPRVAMALSLHAPTQELRADIVPAARGWKMDRLMAALDAYTHASGRAALVQYILLAGVNDTPEVGAALARLLDGRKVKLNLIPYNPNHSVGITQFEAPSPERVARFMADLRAAGIFTTVRKEMGQDVAGACGQLALTVRQQAQQRGGRTAAAAGAAAPAAGSAALGAAAAAAAAAAAHSTARGGSGASGGGSGCGGGGGCSDSSANGAGVSADVVAGFGTDAGAVAPAPGDNDVGAPAPAAGDIEDLVAADTSRGAGRPVAGSAAARRRHRRRRRGGDDDDDTAAGAHSMAVGAHDEAAAAKPSGTAKRCHESVVLALLLAGAVIVVVVALMGLPSRG